MELPDNCTARERREVLTTHRREIINLFVHVATCTHLPRSLGEIFGLIFGSPTPVSFDDIVSQLGLSAGSASQGLRSLKRLGAVKVTTKPGDRRDYYIPETSIRKLLSGYVMETFLFQVAGVHDEVRRLESELHQLGASDSEIVNRLRLLLGWEKSIRSAVHAGLEKLT